MPHCLYCFNEADPEDPSGLCSDHVGKTNDDEWTDEFLDKEPFAWTIDDTTKVADKYYKLIKKS